MIKIKNNIIIDDDELKFTFIRASGPGGQNVNKVSTAVQLKFDVRNSKNLTDEIKLKIIKYAGKKISTKGVLLIEAKRFRTQEKNKSDAIERFTKLILKSTEIKKLRKKTKPTKNSEEKRIGTKKIRSSLKKQRKKIDENF